MMRLLVITTTQLEFLGSPPDGVLGSLGVHAGLGVLAGKPCAEQCVLAGTGAKRKTCAERRTFAGNQFRFPIGL